MTNETRSHVDQLRGASRLAVEATQGITALVEEMHRSIGGGPAILGRPLALPVRLVTQLVYGTIRRITGVVGVGIDGALAQLSPWFGHGRPGPEEDAVLAALNGVLGDYLDETHNPLAIPMRLRREACPLVIEDGALREAIPEAARKLLVLVHGLCMNDRQWCRSGHDHGAALARDLGYEPVYLHYNTGRHISDNGRDLAELLDRLFAAWPTSLDEIAIVTHSMGGLVARSACHAAEQAGLEWRARLRAIVFLGTPHHGAPLERGGNWLNLLPGVSRYSAPLARLGHIRSAGITDLRFGAVLEEHWRGRDRFAAGPDTRTPVALPEGVACYAVAGTTAKGVVGELTGDGLVLVDSALGRHEKPALTLDFAESHQLVAEGVAHLELLDRPIVYEALRSWLSDEPAGSA